jgi:hypothetical protein
MRSVALTVLCIVAVAVSNAAQAATITINFDEVGNPVSTPFNVLGGGYISSGYTITPSDGTAFIVNPADGSNPTMTGGNGSNFLAWGATSPVSITIQRATAFNLDQLLLGTLIDITPVSAGYSITSSQPAINGTAAGVSVLTPSLTNLTAVTINWLSGDSLAIDNIVLSDFIAGPAAVPEPATAAFLGLGSLAMVFRRLRRRTSVVA